MCVLQSSCYQYKHAKIAPVKTQRNYRSKKYFILGKVSFNILVTISQKKMSYKNIAAKAVSQETAQHIAKSWT